MENVTLQNVGTVDRSVRIVAGRTSTTNHQIQWRSTMSSQPVNYRDLTLSVSAGLATLKSSTPEVMKSFSELGRAATANGVLDKKTKELIALALSVAARCDPCIGFHMQSLVKLGVTRQEIDETLGVTTYMGGGPSVMYAASAIAAFNEFSDAR
jgi:AhpD family alkylhydroperoxidase